MCFPLTFFKKIWKVNVGKLFSSTITLVIKYKNLTNSASPKMTIKTLRYIGTKD